MSRNTVDLTFRKLDYWFPFFIQLDAPDPRPMVKASHPLSSELKVFKLHIASFMYLPPSTKNQRELHASESKKHDPLFQKHFAVTFYTTSGHQSDGVSLAMLSINF